PVTFPHRQSPKFPAQHLRPHCIPNGPGRGSPLAVNLVAEASKQRNFEVRPQRQITQERDIFAPGVRLSQHFPRRIHLSTPHSVPDRCRSTPAPTLNLRDLCAPTSATSVLMPLALVLVHPLSSAKICCR